MAFTVAFTRKTAERHPSVQAVKLTIDLSPIDVHNKYIYKLTRAEEKWKVHGSFMLVFHSVLFVKKTGSLL